MRGVCLILGLTIAVPGAAAAQEAIGYVYDVHGRVIRLTHCGSVNDERETTYEYDLADNRTEFLQHADTLLGPVVQTLDKVQAVLADVDKAREGTYRAVTSQLQSLAASQEQLRSATEGLSRSARW